jgi:hypothetical protein
VVLLVDEVDVVDELGVVPLPLVLLGGGLTWPAPRWGTTNGLSGLPEHGIQELGHTPSRRR